MVRLLPNCEPSLLNTVLVLADSPSMGALEQSCGAAVRLWIGVHAFGFYILPDDGMEDGGGNHLYLLADPEGRLEMEAFQALRNGRSLAQLFLTPASLDTSTLTGRHCWRECRSFDYHEVPAIYDVVVAPLVVSERVVGGLLIGGFRVAPPDDVPVFDQQSISRIESFAAACSIALRRFQREDGRERTLRNFADIAMPLPSADSGGPVATDRRPEAIAHRAVAPSTTDSIADRAMLMRLPQRAEAVARLLCEGKSNKVIALKLNLSPHTVRDHVQKLCRRFNCSSRTELIFSLVRGTLN